MSLSVSSLAALSFLERAFAVVMSLLCLHTLVLVVLGTDGSQNGFLAVPAVFNVPIFNIYFLLGSSAAAALLALSIALRNGLSSPAYSLAAGLAAWSGMAPLLIEPEYFTGFMFQVLMFFVWYALPWSAARFALHFPAELPTTTAPGSATSRWRVAFGYERIRRFVDSFAFPAMVVTLGLIILFADEAIASVIGYRATDILLGWTSFLLSASMLAAALLLLTRQRQHADEAGLRRLRWIWLGAWGAVAILVPALGIAFPLLNDKDTMYLAFLLAGTAPYWLIGCVVVAVFFSDALDPKLALRRATLYSILAVLMTTLFILIEGLVQGYIIVNTGMPSTTAIIVAGSVVGISFSPIRRRTEVLVKTLVERLMPAEIMASGRRERVTIAFVDLSGYTSLSDTDERSALVLAAGFHKELTKATTRLGGRVVKKIGDALLLEFRSNDDALRAIREGSVGFAKLVAALELPVLRAHAGVHTGEVVHMSDGDVMGAAVNVAARLMSAAQEDQIVLSLEESELVSADSAAVERVECKGISTPIACRRLAISAS